MPSILQSSLLLVAALGVAANNTPGICSWEEGPLGFCQHTTQGQCSTDRSFVVPQIAATQVADYCQDRGYCCAEQSSGLASRPPRGQTCEDIGKTTLPGCNGPSVNWCRALKSATIATPIDGACDTCTTFAECQQTCTATPGCDGFDFTVDPSTTNGRTCVLIQNAVPYFGDQLELTQADSLWVTWINSLSNTCEDSTPAWYDLNMAVRKFTQSQSGFHATIGASTVLNLGSNIEAIVEQIVDNGYYFVNGEVAKINSESPTKRQLYIAELTASIRDRLRTSPGTLNTVAWTTPSAQYPAFTTYAVIVRDVVYESMLASSFAPSTTSSGKFKTQNALSDNIIVIFNDPANQKVATFRAAVDCLEEGGCTSNSFCLLNNGLCKCRSHYEETCVNDPFVGCQQRVAFLATCGNPDIAWDENSFSYSVTGFGFTAYQQTFTLGKECECGINTPK